MEETRRPQSLDEKQPWYRNSWVVAYWEIEDFAMDIYEVALKPLTILAAVILCWGTFIFLGSGFVVLGQVLLRRLPLNDAQLMRVDDAQLLYTLQLSILGALFASFICIPLLCFVSRRKPGLIWLVLAFICTVLVFIGYGALSGCLGSAVLNALVADHFRYLQPVDALAAGAFGGAVLSPVLAAIILVVHRPVLSFFPLLAS